MKKPHFIMRANIDTIAAFSETDKRAVATNDCYACYGLEPPPDKDKCAIALVRRTGKKGLHKLYICPRHWDIVLVPNSEPSFELRVHLVNYGYQADYLMKGQRRRVGCRDFGGSHPIPKMQEYLLELSSQMIEQFRKNDGVPPRRRNNAKENKTTTTAARLP
jgi:hypothetical protein